MKGMGFPSKIPMFDAVRVTKEVHSIGLVILKFVSHCLTIAFAGKTRILLTMAYNIINSSLRTGHGSSLGKRVLALLKYPFYPMFNFDNGMNLISESLTILTSARLLVVLEVLRFYRFLTNFGA